MIPKTERNYVRLQTPCTHCHHTEWNHYAFHYGGSSSACDNTGCQCTAFQAAPDSPTSVGAQQNIDTPTHQHTMKEES